MPRWPILLLGVTIGVLAACGGPSAPAGPTPGTGSTNPNAATNRYGAPEIQAPRDLRATAPAPCDRLLSPAVLAALGYRTPGRPSANLAPSCRWEADTPQRSVDVAVWVTRDYFVDTYRNRIFVIFRPTTIGGLPAVEGQTYENPTSCNTVVGVAPSQALDVETGIDDLRSSREPVIDPCAEGRRVIEAIIATLPPL